MGDPARGLRWFGVGIAVASGVAALGVLLLPLLLVLLMLLFDSTAHGVAVLLGMLLHGLRVVLFGGDAGAPLFQTIAFHPLEVALSSLARGLPCLAGLVLIGAGNQARARWWWVVALWGLTAAMGGLVAAVLLLPGLAVATLFALGLTGARAGDGKPAR